MNTKRIPSLLMTLALCLSLLPAGVVPAWAADGVTYIDCNWNGSSVVTEEKTCTAYTTVSDSASPVTWNAGWYVVNSDVGISDRITVNGDVNLLLCDGKTLTAQKGITVQGSDTLTIYGQSEGTGKLTAQGGDYTAGIGGGDGGYTSTVEALSGTIVHTDQTTGQQWLLIEDFPGDVANGTPRRYHIVRRAPNEGNSFSFVEGRLYEKETLGATTIQRGQTVREAKDAVRDALFNVEGVQDEIRSKAETGTDMSELHNYLTNTALNGIVTADHRLAYVVDKQTRNGTNGSPDTYLYTVRIYLDDVHVESIISNAVVNNKTSGVNLVLTLDVAHRSDISETAVVKNVTVNGETRQLWLQQNSENVWSAKLKNQSNNGCTAITLEGEPGADGGYYTPSRQNNQSLDQSENWFVYLPAAPIGNNDTLAALKQIGAGEIAEQTGGDEVTYLLNGGYFKDAVNNTYHFFQTVDQYVSGGRGGSGGGVTVNGGMVTATGGENASGIGGGRGGSGGDVTVNGGTVYAWSGSSPSSPNPASAIGGGEGGSPADIQFHAPVSVTAGASEGGALLVPADQRETGCTLLYACIAPCAAHEYENHVCKWCGGQEPSFSVTVAAGTGMEKAAGSGDDAQTVFEGQPIADLVYDALDGYYFPDDYSVTEVSGISVTRDSFTRITISGTPSADADLTLTDAAAKTKPDAPSVTAADCTTEDNNDGCITGVDSTMEYQKEGDSGWTSVSGSTIEDLEPGAYLVRIKATDTALVSDPAAVTIAAYNAPTYTVSFEGNGGSGTMAEVTDVKEGSFFTVPECAFTAPENKQFAHWETAGTEYDPGDSFAVTADTVLMAVWEDVPEPQPEPEPEPEPEPKPEHENREKQPKEEKTFPLLDVPKTVYYYSAVKWAWEKGIAAGTSETTFSPESDATRAQMITYLWAAAGCPEPETAECPFRDVKESAYYYKAVLWAWEKGITGGVGEDTFGVDETVTRGQAMTFLYGAAGRLEAGSEPFTDVNKDDYFAKPVAWAYGNGITAGTSAELFSPEEPCLRGQIVQYLYLYYGK